MATYKLDPRNARRHPEQNKRAVEASLKELGAGRSIVVDADGVVIGGNAVYEQAKKLKIPVREVETSGDELVVVRRVDLKTDDPRRKALALADNQIGTLADWDDDILSELQIELLGEIDLDVMGFELPTEPVNDEEAVSEMVDQAAALLEKWGVERGQVWEIPGKAGVHRVMCGDSCSEEDILVLAGDREFSLVFTSPPYAQQRDYGDAALVADWDGLMDKAFGYMPTSSDAQILVNLGLIHRDGQWVDYWRNWLVAMDAYGWRRFAWYVWDQGFGLMGDWAGRLAPSFEFIFHFNRTQEKPAHWVAKKPASITLAKGTQRERSGRTRGMTSPLSGLNPTKIPDSVIRVKRQVGSDGHPAQYPVDLPAFIIRTWPHDLYDPFLGSGTTVVAAEQEGRVCFGMEIEPKYVAVTLERLSALGLEPTKAGDQHGQTTQGD
jgi:DNA modification methylase